MKDRDRDRGQQKKNFPKRYFNKQAQILQVHFGGFFADCTDGDVIAVSISLLKRFPAQTSLKSSKTIGEAIPGASAPSLSLRSPIGAHSA